MQSANAKLKYRTNVKGSNNYRILQGYGLDHRSQIVETSFTSPKISRIPEQ